MIAQAGSSEPGRHLASRIADMIFTAQSELAEGQDFYREIRARAVAYGRAADDVKVMPGLMALVGETDAAAQALYAELQALIDDHTALRLLSRLTGELDIHAYPLDGPLPALPPSNVARARQAHLVAKARREGLTVRQVARYLGTSLGHQLVVGGPATIADTMQEWLEGGACDGFTLMFPFYPKPLEDFVRLVVPELQRRGIFRTAYEGRTLRANLGVPVPRNRYTKSRG